MNGLHVEGPSQTVKVSNLNTFKHSNSQFRAEFTSPLHSRRLRQSLLQATTLKDKGCRLMNTNSPSERPIVVPRARCFLVLSAAAGGGGITTGKAIAMAMIFGG